jgi:RNA polymerase sigma-70 factor, ECF subfamily
MELRLEAVNLSLGKRTEPIDEFALIERCRKQDVDAFGKLVDAYQSRVFGFVRRMVGSLDDTSDLTQEVFIRAFQNFHRFDGRSSVKTWLFRIAYNLCVDRSRRMDRSPVEIGMQASQEADDWIEVSDDRWEPERLALNEELADAIEDAILSMSDKLRSVLLLHDREDASYEEIAETLGLPVGTVKSRLFLARAHLQNSLKSYLQGESIS